MKLLLTGEELKRRKGKLNQNKFGGGKEEKQRNNPGAKVW